jgi:hypothetical protein
MIKTLFIYLAGTIKKGHDNDKELEWTQEDIDFLKKHIQCPEVILLNPADRLDDLSIQKSVFGRDLFQVFSSHLVLVDGRGKRGLGVGAEMMFAKMNRIPVVTWVPKESYYHRKDVHILGQFVEDYFHPFVENLSDCLAEDLQQAADWINQVYLPGKAHIKGPELMSDCVQHYLVHQLHKDTTMNQWVCEQPRLQEKAANFQN